MRNKRRVLGLILAGAVTCAAPAFGHTPYGQWVVYRQKHLLVGAHRGDGRTYDLAKAVVAGLERELPAAEARVARGPRPERIAALMGTGQLFLAVLSTDEADRMARAEAPFDRYRPTPVHALADLGDGYVLFAAPDFPEDHARLVVQALDHAGFGPVVSGASYPVHATALHYWESHGN